MKAFVLSTVAAVAAILPWSAANGAVLTIGGPLASLCYRAALAHDARASATEVCTRAINEESWQRQTARRPSSTAASCT